MKTATSIEIASFFAAHDLVEGIFVNRATGRPVPASYFQALGLEVSDAQREANARYEDSHGLTKGFAIPAPSADFWTE